MLCFYLEKDYLLVFGIAEGQSDQVKVYFKIKSTGFLDLANIFEDIWQGLYPKIKDYNQVFFINNGGFTDSRILYIWLKSWQKMSDINLYLYSPKRCIPKVEVDKNSQKENSSIGLSSNQDAKDKDSKNNSSSSEKLSNSKSGKVKSGKAQKQEELNGLFGEFIQVLDMLSSNSFQRTLNTQGGGFKLGNATEECVSVSSDLIIAIKLFFEQVRDVGSKTLGANEYSDSVRIGKPKV